MARNFTTAERSLAPEKFSIIIITISPTALVLVHRLISFS
jgi:hypothetical protein